MPRPTRAERRKAKHEAYKAKHSTSAGTPSWIASSNPPMPPMPPTIDLPALSSPPDSPIPSRENTTNRKHIYRRIGGPLGIAAIGIGVTLMTANRFLWGAGLLYFGLALLAADVALEPVFRTLKLRIRLLSGLVYVLLIGVGSRMWIFLPAPLEVFSSSGVVKYGPGSTLHGIEWLPRYSQLTVDIHNPTSTDYDNFDAQLTTDLVINRLVQASGLGECRVDAVHGAGEPPHWQHMHNDQPVGPIDDASWGYEVVPYDKNGNPVAPFAGADWTYRIRCDKIPANSHLVLFGALVVVNEHVYAKPPCLAPCPWPFFDPPKPSKWVTLVAEFQTSGRRRTRTLVRCGTGSTCRKE
jgi:hypothetical protein